jgi:hypothetical protein
MREKILLSEIPGGILLIKLDALEIVLADYLQKHIPKSLNVIANAWILKKESSAAVPIREHDLFIVHADTSFNFPPLLMMFIPFSTIQME